MSINRQQIWYLQKESSELAKRLFGAVSSLENDQKAIDKKDQEYISMYMNRWVGVRPGDYRLNNIFKIKGEIYEPVVNNAVRSAIDTLVNKVSVSAIRPFVAVDGGDWKTYSKARSLQKFIDGFIHEKRVGREVKKAFLECAILGSSFVKYWLEGDEIMVEWQPKNEFVVDQQACSTSEPVELFQIKYVNAETFASKFKDKAIKQRIYDCAESLPGGEALKITNMVKVIEAWKRSSSTSEKNGRHVIAIKDKVLLDEKMGHYFPLVKLDWSKPPRGYFGQGLIENCYGMQKALNEHLQKIQRIIELHSFPQYVVDDGVPLEAITNKEGQIHRGRGIEIHMPNLISPALLEAGLLWEQKIYDSQGVSSMEAQSRAPTQELSAKALRTIKAMSDTRNIEKDEMRSDAFLDLINGVIRLIRESGTNVKVKYKNKLGRYNNISWNDVQISPETYCISLFPTSAFATEPAAKFQQVQEYMASGLISPEMAMDLLEIPDLEIMNEIRLSGYRQAQWAVEQILYEGEDIMPNELMEIPTVISWATSAYRFAMQHNADQDRLRSLEMFITSCMALADKMELEQFQKELQKQTMQQQAQIALQQAMAPQQPQVPPGTQE